MTTLPRTALIGLAAALTFGACALLVDACEVQIRMLWFLPNQGRNLGEIDVVMQRLTGGVDQDVKHVPAPGRPLEHFLAQLQESAFGVDALEGEKFASGRRIGLALKLADGHHIDIGEQRQNGGDNHPRHTGNQPKRRRAKKRSEALPHASRRYPEPLTVCKRLAG